MRKVPYTTSELFDTIVGKLKDKGRLPEILDYHIGSHNPQLIPYYEYRLENSLNFGGNEGIYLDLSIKLWLPEKDIKEVTYHLGTFKTLCHDAEAMRTMGALLGDFVFETSDFIESNIDDFTWYGYECYGETLEGRRCALEVPTLEKALARRDQFFALHDYAFDTFTIRDNKTRQVTVWSRGDIADRIKQAAGGEG